MVHTRRSARGFIAGNLSQEREYQQQSQETRDNASEHNFSQNSYSPDYDNTHNNLSRYRDNDHCKRHRKPDDGEYSEVVTSYRRRKP